MKTLLVSISLLFVISLHICADDEIDFSTGNALAGYLSEAEDVLIRQSDGIAFRTDSATLSIVPETGDTLTFRNPVYVDGYAYTCYNELIGYYPVVNYWVVELTGHEWSAWQLINGFTGIAQSAISAPVLSPDGKRFLCAYRDLIAAFDYNGIQIWRIEQDSLILEFEILDAACMWGPDEVYWESDSSATFNMLEVNWDDFTASSSRGRLVLSHEGSWELESITTDEY